MLSKKQLRELGHSGHAIFIVMLYCALPRESQIIQRNRLPEEEMYYQYLGRICDDIARVMKTHPSIKVTIVLSGGVLARGDVAAASSTLYHMTNHLLELGLPSGDRWTIHCEDASTNLHQQLICSLALIQQRGEQCLLASPAKGCVWVRESIVVCCEEIEAGLVRSRLRHAAEYIAFRPKTSMFPLFEVAGYPLRMAGPVVSIFFELRWWLQGHFAAAAIRKEFESLTAPCSLSAK